MLKVGKWVIYFLGKEPETTTNKPVDSGSSLQEIRGDFLCMLLWNKCPQMLHKYPLIIVKFITEENCSPSEPSWMGSTWDAGFLRSFPALPDEMRWSRQTDEMCWVYRYPCGTRSGDMDSASLCFHRQQNLMGQTLAKSLLMNECWTTNYLSCLCLDSWRVIDFVKGCHLTTIRMRAHACAHTHTLTIHILSFKCDFSGESGLLWKGCFEGNVFLDFAIV